MASSLCSCLRQGRRLPPLAADPWKQASPDYVVRLPADHVSHPAYRIEWWYYTGNLETDRGRRFGYQITFFRVGIDRRR